MRTFSSTHAAIYCVCFLLLLLNSQSDKVDDGDMRPNILHIVVDDWGWAYRPGSENGNNESQTPSLDLLADEGLILSRHYAHKICSPSRSALLSGRAPIHVNVQNLPPEVRNPEDPVSGYQGIPLGMTLVSEVMQNAGYRTAMVGKWDVGMATSAHHPGKRGFDSWLGYWHHANDYWQLTTEQCQVGSVTWEKARENNARGDKTAHGGGGRGGDSKANGQEGNRDVETVEIRDMWRFDQNEREGADAAVDAPATDLLNDASCSQHQQLLDDTPLASRCVFEEEILAKEAERVIRRHRNDTYSERSGNDTLQEQPLFLVCKDALTVIFFSCFISHRLLPKKIIKQKYSSGTENARTRVLFSSFMEKMPCISCTILFKCLKRT